MLKKVLCFALYFLYPALSMADAYVFAVVPKSGPYKVFGDELTLGAQVAVDEINASGGLQRQKLQLIFIDDACNETLALSTAQMLSFHPKTKPSLIIGPYCSGGLQKIAETYRRAKIFQIVPAFLSSDEARQSASGLIKLFGNKETAASDLFDFYNANFAGLSVALISFSEDKTFDNAIMESFKKHGKSSLVHNYHFSDYNSLDDLTDALVHNKENIIMAFSEPKHTAKIIKKVSAQTSQAIFITSRYLATSDFFINAEDNLKTTYFMALSELENKPEMVENVVTLRLKGIEFQGLNIYGYTAVKLWAELVKKAKTFNYDKLSSYIKKYGLQTSWGETFYNNGNLSDPIKYVFYQFKNDEFILAPETNSAR